MIDPGTVYFVGSGPGDPDLITLRAKELIETADVVVYSGSLLNPEILKYAKKNAELIDAALIDRERIYEILRDSTKEGKLAIRFHDGDPAIFSTIREQIDKLERDQLQCKVVPGITALLAAGLRIEHRTYRSRNYPNNHNYKGRVENSCTGSREYCRTRETWSNNCLLLEHTFDIGGCK